LQQSETYQEAQLSLGWPDRTAYIRKPTSDFR